MWRGEKEKSREMETTHTTEKPVFVRMKTFATLQEILDDKQFEIFANEEIKRIRLQRSVQPPAGYKWSRGAYEQMTEQSTFSFEYMKAEYPAIVLKQSNLSSAIRRLIEFVMMTAVQKTYQFYTTTE